MIIINYLFRYNWIFRYYLLIIFFFNLVLFYIFAIERFFRNKTEHKKDLFLDNIDSDIKYCFSLEKIIKIIKNPIIFDYQILQIHSIDTNSDKYIQYYEYLLYIQNNKQTKSYVYYKKAKKLLSNYYAKTKTKTKTKTNTNEKNIILAKLLCINFH